jgi:hypothetical protein
LHPVAHFNKIDLLGKKNIFINPMNDHRIQIILYEEKQGLIPAPEGIYDKLLH